MKTKLTFLLAALTLSGLSEVATAGPDLSVQAWRNQVAASQRVSARSPEVSGYVTVNNNHANPRPVAVRGQGVTNIAVFKSKKTQSTSACESCSANAKR